MFAEEKGMACIRSTMIRLACHLGLKIGDSFCLREHR